MGCVCVVYGTLRLPFVVVVPRLALPGAFRGPCPDVDVTAAQGFLMKAIWARLSAVDMLGKGRATGCQEGIWG